MGPQIGAGTERSSAFSSAFDAPDIPPPPSIPLWKVQPITDRRPAVTCLIMGDVWMPGTALASLLPSSMRDFHQATDEISAENRAGYRQLNFQC